MEAAFTREIRLLINALRYPTFRFIVIGHNRKSIITDVTAYIQTTYPDRPYHELRLSGKTYREIIDGLKDVQEGIIVIPDFDWLFQPGNEDICIGFNQRRDALAKLPVALLCFVEPSGYRNLPKRIPDWWSLRSLELEFERETTDERIEFLNQEQDVSTLGGQTKEEKKAEIGRLLEQLEGIEPENTKLLSMLLDQIATLYYELSDYEKAKIYLEARLTLVRKIGNKQDEGTTLNNIGQIYDATGNYDTALTYLQKSLSINQQIGDKEGEGATLNNISQIYSARGDYETALTYLQQSLSINQQIGDKQGEGRTLNNLAGIARAKGDYNTALMYLQQSLIIKQQIGDKKGEATSLHNIGVIYFEQNRDVEQTLSLLWQAYLIRKQLGSPDADDTAKYLNSIRQKIGDERYHQIIQSLPETEEL